MKKSRRDFIAGSAAMGVIGVTEASAQPARKTTAQRGRRALPANPTVGVLHSTTFDAGDDQGKAFLQGLSANGVTLSPADLNRRTRQARGDYGDGALEHLAVELITREGVNLMVAAGGLVSGRAAAVACGNYPTCSFVYLIGRYPRPGEGSDIFLNSAQKLGGVNQNTPDQNEANWKALSDPQRDPTIKATDVALIVNDKAAMTGAESQMWNDPRNGHDPDSVVANTDPNTNNLVQLFRDIAALRLPRGSNTRPKGLVVSADPFFRTFKEQFDTRLRAQGQGNFAGWVCYPYEDFRPSQNPQYIISPTTPPLFTSGNAGDQKAGYYQLGIITAAAFKTQAPRSVMWNGKDWVTQTVHAAPSIKRRRR
jgi:hypothetical protein